MKKFAIVITGHAPDDVSLDHLRAEVVAGIEGVLLPRPDMTLDGMQFRELKTKETSDVGADPARSVPGDGRGDQQG